MECGASDEGRRYMYEARADFMEFVFGGEKKSRSNQRWMKLRTTVQLSSAISSTIKTSKPTLQMEDSFIKRFSTRQVAEKQETLDTGNCSDCSSGSQDNIEYVHRKCLCTYTRH
ncbi:hypothetical protein ACI65C_003235 [Semiaphis heraclei]